MYYIKVAFKDKDRVKELGARWDKEKRSWYVPDDEDKDKFKEWENHDPLDSLTDSNAKKIYLTVPFSEKDEVKQLGARWDNDKKQWYFFADRDETPFKKWMDSNVGTSSKTNSSTKKQSSQNNDLSDELDDILNLGD